MWYFWLLTAIFFMVWYGMIYFTTLLGLRPIEHNKKILHHSVIITKTWHAIYNFPITNRISFTEWLSLGERWLAGWKCNSLWNCSWGELPSFSLSGQPQAVRRTVVTPLFFYDPLFYRISSVAEFSRKVYSNFRNRRSTGREPGWGRPPRCWPGRGMGRIRRWGETRGNEWRQRHITCRWRKDKRLGEWGPQGE